MAKTGKRLHVKATSASQLPTPPIGRCRVDRGLLLRGEDSAEVAAKANRSTLIRQLLVGREGGELIEDVVPEPLAHRPGRAAPDT
jgi:hypothetical protein